MSEKNPIKSSTADSVGASVGGVIDAVVVGAGFAGMYTVKKMVDLGFSVRCYEAGSGVGGTWFWNQYPGAQCDVESLEYSYGFSDELQQEWNWSQRFAPQPEILAYANHVADKFDLRRHIQFNTRVQVARYDESRGTWELTLASGERVCAKYLILGTGNLSTPRVPEIAGLDQFKGNWYHSSRWPAEGVDLTGKRVAVIGTGSTGIQIIPIVAQQAQQLLVFQRSPNYVIPAQNAPLAPSFVAEYKHNYAEKRVMAQQSQYGMADLPVPKKAALEVTPEEREERYESLWQHGSHTTFMTAFKDLLISQEANDTAADFVRRKIHAIVKDPQVAGVLSAFDHPLGARRLCAGTDYYETYNRPNVTLVDVSHAPIDTFTPAGLRSGGKEYEFDVLIFATGFDAMTGALREIDIRGRAGLALNDKWKHGPRTYLGLAVEGFPNMFVITGPGSPSVKSNVILSIEQHVDWIARCLVDMRNQGQAVIEADREAESQWVQHVNDVAAPTLYVKTNSWYTGANVPGKPRVFMPYVGGIGTYRRICDEVAADHYRGFHLSACAGASASTSTPLSAA